MRMSLPHKALTLIFGKRLVISGVIDHLTLQTSVSVTFCCWDKPGYNERKGEIVSLPSDSSFLRIVTFLGP